MACSFIWVEKNKGGGEQFSIWVTNGYSGGFNGHCVGVLQHIITHLAMHNEVPPESVKEEAGQQIVNCKYIAINFAHYNYVSVPSSR